MVSSKFLDVDEMWRSPSMLYSVWTMSCWFSFDSYIANPQSTTPRIKEKGWCLGGFCDLGWFWLTSRMGDSILSMVVIWVDWLMARQAEMVVGSQPGRGRWQLSSIFGGCRIVSSAWWFGGRQDDIGCAPRMLWHWVWQVYLVLEDWGWVSPALADQGRWRRLESGTVKSLV